MAVSDAQRRANKKYVETKAAQVKLVMPKKEADDLRSFCKTKGYSVAGFIRKAVKETIRKEASEELKKLLGGDEGDQ